MGLATAKLLASRGAIISLADINEDAMKAAAASLHNSSKHLCTAVDVRDATSVQAWIDGTVQKLGHLDGAVNMAGVIAKAVPVTEVTDHDWDFSFAVNAKGVFNCLRAQLKAMTAGGSIVSEVMPYAMVNLSDCTGRCRRRASLGSLVRRVMRHTALPRQLLLDCRGRLRRRTSISG